MTNKPKNIGTATETAVVRYLRADGFPHAERRALHGSTDLGDITGTPGVCWEVKGGKAAEACAPADLVEWQRQTRAEQEAARAVVGVLVVKRKGVGPANAGDWWAYLPLAQLVELVTGESFDDYDAFVWARMTLSEVVHLLRAGGYGTPL